MYPPVKSFLSDIIDYAGLFPPAKLSMAEAFPNFLQYSRENDAWMMSRFICPARRLAEILEQSHDFSTHPSPLVFSVLLSGGKNSDEWLNNFRIDLDAINHFQSQAGENVRVDFLECRLPLNIIRGSDAEMATFFQQFATMLKHAGLNTTTPFFEIGFGRGWEKQIPKVVRAISDFGKTERSDNPDPEVLPGFKIRCGGVEPQMYPTVKQIATAILHCRNQQIPLKATAGLHHPLRHFNAEAGLKMHGFLNVFGAGIMAKAHELELPEICEIIEDETAENFLFSERAFIWKTLRVSLGEIEVIRRTGLISFGSCSFDEPREDLRHLNIL